MYCSSSCWRRKHSSELFAQFTVCEFPLKKRLSQGMLPTASTGFGYLNARSQRRYRPIARPIHSRRLSSDSTQTWNLLIWFMDDKTESSKQSINIADIILKQISFTSYFLSSRFSVISHSCQFLRLRRVIQLKSASASSSPSCACQFSIVPVGVGG